MTKVQIKDEVRKLQKAEGRARYTKELKKAIIGTLGEFKSQEECGQYYNISGDRISKWKRALSGIVQARTVQHGKTGLRYAISTKIEACEQVLKYDRTINSVAQSFGVAFSTLAIWIDDYKAGKYTLDNVVQISRKKFRTYDIIIADIEKKTSELNSLKEEAKEALRKEYEEKMTALEANA